MIPCSPFSSTGPLSVLCCTDSCFTFSVFQILIPPKGLFTKLKKRQREPRKFWTRYLTVFLSSFLTVLFFVPVLGPVTWCGCLCLW